MRISDWSSDVCSSDLAILAKAMSEESLKQVAAIISAKKVSLTPEEARELAKRALKFKQERGRLQSITSPDAWEKRMAEGDRRQARTEEHTSELQSLMRISYAVSCLTTKTEQHDILIAHFRTHQIDTPDLLFLSLLM